MDLQNKASLERSIFEEVVVYQFIPSEQRPFDLPRKVRKASGALRDETKPEQYLSLEQIEFRKAKTES